MGNAFNNRFLPWLAFCFLVSRVTNVGIGGFHQLETGNGIVQARVIVPQALNMMMRRFQVLVGNQNKVYFQARFDLGDIGAFFVQQECSDVDRYLCVQGSRVFLHGLFLQQAQYMQRAGFCIADDASAIAAGAGNVRTLVQCRTQALSRQLHEAETGYFAHLDPCTVKVKGVSKALFNKTLVLVVLHIDEVDDDQAAQVAQTKLAGNFLGRFQVGSHGRFFDIGTASRAR